MPVPIVLPVVESLFTKKTMGILLRSLLLCQVSLANDCYITFHYSLMWYVCKCIINKLWLWHNISVSVVSIDFPLVAFPMLSYMNMPCSRYCSCCGMWVQCLPTNHGVSCYNILLWYQILCPLINQWVTWTFMFPLFLVVVLKGHCLPKVEFYRFQSFRLLKYTNMNVLYLCMDRRYFCSFPQKTMFTQILLSLFSACHQTLSPYQVSCISALRFASSTGRRGI